MSTSDVLHELFATPQRAVMDNLPTLVKEFGPPESDVADDDPFARLLRVATRTDRRAGGALAGHQAAIRRLFPSTPADAICAFCISEARGPHPKYIDTALTSTDTGFLLTGSKKWGSVAPDADLLYVAASMGREGDTNDLRMVALPADRPGITFDLEPYRDYGTEMRIADIEFDAVEITADDIIEGDAYTTFIKPFRLIEDVYNSAGVQVAMFRLGSDHGWPDDLLETLAGLVCQAAAISSTDMASPQSIVLLSSYFQASGDFWTQAWERWSDPPPEVIEAWQPERGLLEVAARARETRRQRAWDQLRQAEV